MHILAHAVLALGLLSASAHAIGTNDQVNSNLDFGTFQNPSANVRARFRYWVNDASHSLSRVADDVRSVTKAGAGGVELLGYYLYGETGNFFGSVDAVVQTDWTVYGFGEGAWKTLQDTVLSTAIEENVIIDLAIGPNQGAGVPAEYNDDGLLWDLAAFNLTVPKGATYSSLLPGWGGAYNSETLVAATAGLVVNQLNSTLTLSTTSLIDLTCNVSSTGTLSHEFGDAEEGSFYVLFAFYLKRTGTREVNTLLNAPIAVPQSPVTNFLQNGSFVVDHFSAAGAQVIIDFWAQHLLSGNTTAVLREVGNFLWEDSQEYNTRSNVLWTPALPRVFEENRGYSFNMYLPLIFAAKGSGLSASTAGGGGVAAFPETYVLDEEDGGVAHIQDFQQTLTELNSIYLTTLTTWTNTLGLQFSAQIGYNLPLDLLALIPLPNGPECETLAFAHSIDAYRQFAGPANLAGKRSISSETGAVQGAAYTQTIPDLLWDVKRSVAGGVNQAVLHGFPYSGGYGGTTWPGFTTFNGAFSEMHGSRQPGWEGAREWLDWMGRTQWVAQRGVPRVDLAFWLKSTEAWRSPATQYVPLDLQDAGYTYNYLSPDNLHLPSAYVANTTLAPNRQAFKALIIRANASLTLPGVLKLVEYAHAGLPIILSGGIPTTTFGYNQTNGKNLTAIISGLTRLDNVHIVPYEGLASSLAALGIAPRTAIATSSGSWNTYWRDDGNASGAQFVYIYNDAAGVPPAQASTTTGNISFETTGRPFLYDAWTGAVTAISSYQQSATHTTIPLELAGNQSIIIGFHSNLPTTTNESVTIHAANTITPLPLAKSTLTNWTLTIESWTPPADILDIEAGSTKTNTSYALPTLVPWQQLSPSLRNVSGRGFYRTTFTWPPPAQTNINTTFAGAFLDLGAIVHTARMRVNGRAVPPLDPTWARADVGGYLVEGMNVVEVVVSTPLGNALRGVWEEVRTSGRYVSELNPDPPGVADYGLVGEVVLIPYST